MHVYNDVFVEELVRRKRFASEVVIRILIVIVAIILILAAFIFLRPFSPVITTLVVVVAWLGSRYTVVEYEYSFVNGELDIDQILGKRRRKNVLSVNCKTIKTFEQYKGDEFDRRNNKIVDAARSLGSADNWVITTGIFDNGQEYLIFSPSERMIEAIRQYMPKIKQ